MLELIHTKSSRLAPGWPCPDYVHDLAAVGLDLNHWELAGPSDATGDDARCESTQCLSWTDGEVGLFAQDIHASRMHIDALATIDLFAVAIPMEDLPGRILRVDGGGEAERPEMLEFLSIPAGSRLSVISERGGMQSITLVVRADALHRMCGGAMDALPLRLRMAAGKRAGSVTAHPIPCVIEQIARDILNVAFTDRFVPLFGKGKSAELLHALLHHWRPENGGGTEAEIDEGERLGVGRARKMVEEDPIGTRSADDLARLCGMNRTKLRYLFKRIYGTTITDFRTAILMRWADEMLSGTELPIAEIGFKLGYSEASSFNIAYRRFFGHTPGRMRRH